MCEREREMTWKKNENEDKKKFLQSEKNERRNKTKKNSSILSIQRIISQIRTARTDKSRTYLPEALHLVGNNSAGIAKMVVKGPQLKKKNVAPNNTNHPANL